MGESYVVGGDNSQAILYKLDVLIRKVDGLDARLDRLERQVDALRGGASSTLEALDRKVTVSIRNAPHRSVNGVVIHDEVELAPMLSVLTGEPVDGFPETLGHLDQLEEPVVDHLLTHLGQHLGGGECLEAKRKRLAHTLGVVSRAV